jgi:hypothetical protein
MIWIYLLARILGEHLLVEGLFVEWGGEQRAEARII